MAIIDIHSVIIPLKWVIVLFHIPTYKFVIANLFVFAIDDAFIPSPCDSLNQHPIL